MKIILVSGLFWLSSVALADEGNFEAKKQKMLDGLNKRIEALQTAVSCAESAADQAALKACRKALKESHKGMKRMKKKDR